MEERQFAMLIDGDNISAKYIAAILNELSDYGIATYKRIYGDWTSSGAVKWKDVLLTNSITPIQQFSNVSGKNATDSALIIDAMDILYEGRVDGFCIVSSDSDFTRLASRLRESGMTVIGMGEEKTPDAFRNACSKFVRLENILDTYVQDGGDTAYTSRGKKRATVSRTAVENTIAGIITENENKGKATGLGEVGSRVGNKYPDFDVRSYGYSLLSKFLEESSRFVITDTNRGMTVSLRAADESGHQVEDYITARVREAGSHGINLSPLGNMVHDAFPKFRFKDKGYSKFSVFVASIPGLVVRECEDGITRAYYEQ